MNHLSFSLVAAAVALLFAQGTAHALVSFGPPSGINPIMAMDTPEDTGIDSDKEPSMAGNSGSGTWIAVWASTNDLGGTIGNDFDILTARSTDDGRTWTDSAALVAMAATDAMAADTQPRVVNLGGADWLAVWTSTNDLSGAIGTDTDILSSRSADDGLTWSVPIAVNSDAASDNSSTSLDQAPAIAVGSNAVVTWQKIETSITQFYRSGSTDGGLSWGARGQLGGDSTTGFAQGVAVTAAGGGFVAAWSSTQDLGGLGTDTDILTASIADAAGFAVGAPAALNPDAASDTRNDKFPALAANGTDAIAIWEGKGGGAPSADELDIYAASSSDSGATWGAQTNVNSNAASDTGEDERARISMDSDIAIAVWSSNDTVNKTIKDDDDILFARSTDGGATWTPVRAIASTAGKDKGGDEDAAIANDGSNIWVVAWRSADTLGKTLGIDDDILFVRAEQNCPSAPSAPASCFEPQSSGKGSLLIKDGEKKDLLKWKFAKGPAVDKGADVGNPSTTDDYVLCVYDETGMTAELVTEMDAHAGGECFSKNCWKETTPGFLYKHKFGSISGLSVSAGTAGKSKAQVKGLFGFESPTLPLSVDSTVTVQLHNLGTGACWSTSISAAGTNSAAQFKGKSD